MGTHKVTIDGNSTIEVYPLRVTQLPSVGWTIEFTTRNRLNELVRVFIPYQRITHWDGEEIFEIHTVRPLTTHFYKFDKPILRIVVDTRDLVDFIDVIRPEEESN